MTTGARCLLGASAALFLVTGCAAAPGDAADDGQRAESARSAAPPATTATPKPTAAPVDLTFGPAEEQIDGDWVVGWLAPFDDGSERFVHEDSDGSAVYTYRDTQNDCTIIMELHRLADREMPQDDRLISDMLLSTNVLGSTSADDIEAMAALAEEDSLWQEEKEAAVDFRIWYGMSESSSAVLAARGFGGMAAGMLMLVSCPGEEAVAEYKEIVDDYARILVRWPTDE